MFDLFTSTPINIHDEHSQAPLKGLQGESQKTFYHHTLFPRAVHYSSF